MRKMDAANKLRKIREEIIEIENKTEKMSGAFDPIQEAIENLKDAVESLVKESYWSCEIVGEDE